MKLFRFSIIGIAFFFQTTAIAIVTADELLINFSKRVPLIYNLIVNLAAFVGFAFIFRALIKLKIYGEMRTMMSPHARLNQVLLLLVSGVLLIHLTEATIPVMLDALFGSSTITQLPYEHEQSTTAMLQLATKRVVQVIGVFSLMRGIMQVAGHQEGGRHPIGKAITHIVSGVFAINIQLSLDLLQGLFR